MSELMSYLDKSDTAFFGLILFMFAVIVLTEAVYKLSERNKTIKGDD